MWPLSPYSRAIDGATFLSDQRLGSPYRSLDTQGAPRSTCRYCRSGPAPRLERWRANAQEPARPGLEGTRINSEPALIDAVTVLCRRHDFDLPVEQRLLAESADSKIAGGSANCAPPLTSISRSRSCDRSFDLMAAAFTRRSKVKSDLRATRRAGECPPTPPMDRRRQSRGSAKREPGQARPEGHRCRTRQVRCSRPAAPCSAPVLR